MKSSPNSDMKQVLCCCEYRNEDGKKSHVLAVCCDCEVIDQAFERLITCKPMSSNTCSRILTVISDRLRVPWCDGQGARKVDPEVMLAVLLMPFTMVIAAQGWFWTICTFLFLPIIFIFLFLKFTRTRPHTHFFASWSITSFVFLIGVFELEVVPYLEILFSENLILMCFVAITCLCAYLTRINSSSSALTFLKISSNSNRNMMKATVEETQWQKCVICNMIQPPRSNHCKLCGHCVLRKDHHCVWLDICVGARNHRYFVVGLLSLLISCAYGANLTLTTICHPTLVWDTVLLPDNCSDVYGDIHISLCFVSAAYTLLIAGAAFMTLLHQFWLICHNTTLEEWKQGQSGLYNRGILKNCAEFCHGY